MENKKLERFFIILMGAMRSGKSFLAKYIASQYVKSRGTIIVYNPGKDSDYPGFETIKPLTKKEHLYHFYSDKHDKYMYSLNPKIEYFFWNDEIYHFQDFNVLFFKKSVKIRRVKSKREEGLFFNTISDWISNCLLILDDARGMFKSGIPDEAAACLSRINHCGEECQHEFFKDKGIDVIAIFHNLDRVNSEFYDYCTRIILFKSMNEPKGNKFENVMVYNSILESYEKLLKLPKYYFYEISTEKEPLYIPVLNKPLNLKS